MQLRVLSTLLNEMDGIAPLAHVVVVGATNRPDMIDAALLRPGRFDEIIEVGLPDEAGRLQILKIHAKAMRLDEGEILTARGYPCWNPPCRRTIVTVALNGVDFVGRPAPLVYYFFVEPWRAFSMMWDELQLLIFTLGAVCVINSLLTWQWRFEVYARYLRIKYRVKNRIIFPLTERGARKWSQMNA